MNHTPLPWELTHGVQIRDQDKNMVAHLIYVPNGEANASLIVEAVNTRPALLAQIEELEKALHDLTPPMPSKNAFCHNGICEQSACIHCQRIARAHKLLSK